MNQPSTSREDVYRAALEAIEVYTNPTNVTTPGPFIRNVWDMASAALESPPRELMVERILEHAAEAEKADPHPDVPEELQFPVEDPPPDDEQKDVEAIGELLERVMAPRQDQGGFTHTYQPGLEYLDRVTRAALRWEGRRVSGGPGADAGDLVTELNREGIAVVDARGEASITWEEAEQPAAKLYETNEVRAIEHLSYAHGLLRGMIQSARDHSSVTNPLLDDVLAHLEKGTGELTSA